MQAGHCAFLWNNPTWSDFNLDVLAADAAEDAEPLYTLKLQSVILAVASPGHFKEHCTRLREEAAQSQPVESAPKRRKSTRASAQTPSNDAAPQHPYGYKLFLEPGEPLEVPRAVLCHLHTCQLPDDPEQLIWMLRRADYLDLADTLHAALRKLLAIDTKQLNLQHALLLSAYPHYQCDEPRPQEQAAEPAAGEAAAPAAAATAAAPPAAQPKAIDQVHTLIDTLLTTHFPSAPAIVTDAALLAQFTQLPLALVKRWVELDKYEVDSGNTLAVLFTAWHDAQPEPPTEEQCKQLSALLPLAAVSLCFHVGALRHLRWWREPHEFKCDALVAHILAHKPGLYKAKWSKSVGGLAVAQRAAQAVKRTWTVGATEAKQLWETRQLFLPRLYFAGSQHGLFLTLDHSKRDTDKTKGLFLGFRKVISWSDPIQQHCPALSKPAELLSIAVQVQALGKEFADVSEFHADTWGWPAIPSLPAPSLEAITAAGITVSLELSKPM